MEFETAWHMGSFASLSLHTLSPRRRTHYLSFCQVGKDKKKKKKTTKSTTRQELRNQFPVVMAHLFDCLCWLRNTYSKHGHTYNRLIATLRCDVPEGLQGLFFALVLLRFYPILRFTLVPVLKSRRSLDDETSLKLVSAASQAVNYFSSSFSISFMCHKIDKIMAHTRI